MSEVSLQNTAIKVSAAKDSIQSKGIRKTDSTFKNVLEGVSSEKSTLEKKSLDVSKNTVNDNKAEVKKDGKVEAVNVYSTKTSDDNSETLNNKTEAESLNQSEVIDDSKTSIKLSSKEISELEAFVEKLQLLVNDTSSDEKSDIKVDDVMKLFQMNLTNINNTLDALKGKNLSAVGINNEVQSSQINLDLIDELSKMQNQITDIMSILSTSGTGKDTKLSGEEKDILNVDLSEHSMNAEKNDTKDSDIILELCGMVSVLSQVAALKTEQIQNVDNKSEVQSQESLKEIKTLNNSISVIKELLQNSSQMNPEIKKDYSKLAQIAEKTITSKNDNAVVAVDKLNLKELPESKEAVSRILKILTNNNENLNVDLKTGSEIEKLINKFVVQANDLGQKLKISNEVNSNEFVKIPTPNTANLVDNNAMNFAKKLTNEVRRKIEGGDAVFDTKQNKFVIYEEKTDTSFIKENFVQTPSSDIKTENSSLNKEDKLLLKLTSDEKSTDKDDMSSKIARVTNLATSLHVEKNIPVEATEKLPVVNRQTFNEDIVKSIKYMELNQVKELTVKVMPKELGELYIKITREGEVVKAQITATNKEAYNVLNSNLSDITKQLSEQNIKIHTFNVEIFNGDSGFYNQGSKNENGNSQSKRKNSLGSLEVEEVGSTEDILNEFNNVNALA